MNSKAGRRGRGWSCAYSDCLNQGCTNFALGAKVQRLWFTKNHRQNANEERQAVAPAAQRKSRPLFLEVLCRSLIILCVALSVVLSSVAVCDGHWLLSDRRMFGLWFFCVVEDSVVAPNCSRHIGEGLDPGLCVCRSVVSLGVVSAIFGLELLVMSQVSEGRASSQRWHLGAWLVLLAAGLAAGGVATFVFLFWEHATPLGFTLTFWCQFTATFLFFLNGMAARHIQNMAELLPSSGHLGKP